jgi:DNA-binding PadR family transcriptional regulator
MSVKHALLGILSESPKHGYDIKRTFDEKLGVFWNLNYGQIYTTLERLEEEGLVRYEEIAQSDKPDKKVYEITTAGRQEFDSWRTKPIKPEPRALRDELFLKVLFMTEDDIESVLALLQAQQNVYLSQMMQITNRKFEIEQTARTALQNAANEEARRGAMRERLVSLVLLDVALFHAEADIRWLRHCEARVRELARGEGR